MCWVRAMTTWKFKTKWQAPWISKNQRSRALRLPDFFTLPQGMDSAARAQEMTIQKRPSRESGKDCTACSGRIALHEGDSRTASTSKCTPSQQKGQQHFLVIAGLPFMKKNLSLFLQKTKEVIAHVPMPQIWEQGAQKKGCPCKHFHKKICVYIYVL